MMLKLIFILSLFLVKGLNFYSLESNGYRILYDIVNYYVFYIFIFEYIKWKRINN